jgi:hypothetical protein
MDPFIITHGIRWLPAVDAFSASCVSQEWYRVLSANVDDGDFWKQICQNSGPSDIPNLESSADYRRLAMGLRLRENAPPAPREQTYTPITRPENYFAVVDFYKRHDEENGKRRKEMITSLVCHVNGMKIEVTIAEVKPAFQGPNPFAACLTMEESGEVHAWREEVSSEAHFFVMSTPFAYASWIASGRSWESNRLDSGQSIRVDVTLFRRDNAKSVCLLHDVALDGFSDYMEEETQMVCTGLEVVKFAATDSGKTARSLLNERNVVEVSVEAELHLVPMLPSSTSNNEPMWLRNCREAISQEFRYEPNESDKAVLSKISHFDFGVKKLTVVWWPVDSYTDGFYEFKSQDEVLVVLEGLCWE